VHSATPEELQLCTCITAHLLNTVPQADFHHLERASNAAKLDRFKAAVADATKQCGDD
jgi:hypothetical protein